MHLTLDTTLTNDRMAIRAFSARRARCAAPPRVRRSLPPPRAAIQCVFIEHEQHNNNTRAHTHTQISLLSLGDRPVAMQFVELPADVRMMEVERLGLDLLKK